MRKVPISLYNIHTIFLRQIADFLVEDINFPEGNHHDGLDVLQHELDEVEVDACVILGVRGCRGKGLLYGVNYFFL